MTRMQANLSLVLVAALWGGAFVAQQDAMENMGPFWFTGIRFALGTLIVAPLAFFEWRKTVRNGSKIPMAHIAGFMLCGCFLFTASVLQQIGLISTTVTNSGFLTALYIPLVPLFGLVLFRMVPHVIVWPAGIACVFGIWMLSGGGFEQFTEGDLWTFAGAIFWAAHVLAVGIMAQKSGTPLILAGTQFATAAIVGTFIAVGSEPFSLPGIEASLWELGYAGFLSVGIAFTIQAVAQKYTGPADAAIIMSSESLFAALSGAVFQAERLTVQQYSGAAIIFAAVLAVEVLPLLRRKIAARSAATS